MFMMLNTMHHKKIQKYQMESLREACNSKTEEQCENPKLGTNQIEYV